MNTQPKSRHLRHSAMALAAVAAAVTAGTSSAWDDEHHSMTLHSTTFENGGTLPLSMINNSPNGNGGNACTADGATGGNESPQLSWKHAPHNTRSFVVIAYDIVAQFTHWQMYNIPADTTTLPQNAGIQDSDYGQQNGNDFFQASYDGPCPPTGPGQMPFSHRYRFTVYALDTFLPTVQTFGTYFVPAGPEGLYQELITAGERGHILASASIEGHFSAAAND